MSAELRPSRAPGPADHRRTRHRRGTRRARAVPAGSLHRGQL